MKFRLVEKLEQPFDHIGLIAFKNLAELINNLNKLTSVPEGTTLQLVADGYGVDLFWDNKKPILNITKFGKNIYSKTGEETSDAISFVKETIRLLKQDKRLDEATSKEGATMVRNDGKVIPVSVHIYGNEDLFLNNEYEGDPQDISETVEASIWLFENTGDENTKHLCLEFIANWIDNSIFPLTSDNRIPDFIEAYNNQEIYFDSTKSVKFIKSHEKSLKEFPVAEDDSKLESLAKEVCKKLDQEFLRVRLGGTYDTGSNTKGNIYFRVSSTGFDWFPIISKIVLETHPKNITICRDKESTGEEKFYQYNGQPIYEMPFNDFLYISDRFVVEKYSY